MWWQIGAFVLSFAVSYLSAKKAQSAAKKMANDMAGTLVNKESAVEPIPVIYGERKIGGTRVFVATKDVRGGDPNEYLYLVLALCEGEVEDITDITIDDLSLDSVEGSTKYSGNYLITKYYGSDSQTADPTLVAANVGWTSNHRLQGIAYIAIRLLWDKNKFSSIPEITCKVKGVKVYDPRTSTTAWSNNPALCIRDYLTNERYGKGLDPSVIDDVAFSQAATDCDNFTAEVYSGGATQKIFVCNAIIDTGATVFRNLEQMLLGCRGFIPYSQGKYSLLIDKSSSSVFAFDTDTILSGISIRGENKDEKYNKVNCKFVNPDGNWQEDAAFWPDAGSLEETTFLSEDNGVTLSLDLDLPTITDYYSARDIARVVLLRSRNALRVQFQATSEALQLSVSDVVTVTHPTPGFESKPFQVEQIVMNYDGTVSIGLLEYDSTIYTYDPSSEQRSYPDTVLPDPLFVAPPSAITVLETTYLGDDGTVIPEIQVTWTPTIDAFIQYYEIQYKPSASSYWISLVSPDAFYVTSFAEVGLSYDIRVRAVNTIGTQSEWTNNTYTVVGDTSAPSAPTGVSIVGSYNEAVINWDSSTAKDYKETILYASLTNSFGTATEQARVSGNTATYYNLPISTTYYVWLRHIDFTGNISPTSSAISFTTTAGITSSELADGSVTANKIVTSAVTSGKIASNAVTTAKINASAVTEAKIGTSAVTETKIGTGAVTNTKIVDGAVTNAKLDANAIAANVFAAGVQPIGIEATVPVSKTVDTIFVTADSKLYRWSGSSYVKTVDDGDITGMTVSKLTAGTINAAITTTNILQLSTAGKIYTAGKTSAASTTAGIFLGHDGASSYDFAVGDASKSLVYDGSSGALTFSGDLVTTGQVKATGATTSSFGTACIVGETTVVGRGGVIGISTVNIGVFGQTNSASGVYGKATNSAGTGVYATNTGGGAAIIVGSGSSDLQSLSATSGTFSGAVSGSSLSTAGTMAANAITVSSTTRVANLNATRLYDKDWTEYCSLLVGNSGTAYASGAGFNITVGAGMGGSYAFTASSNNVVLDVISDERLKKDILPETLGLEFVNSLNPVTYRMISGTDMLHHGFIAQDVEAILGKGDDSLTVENADGIKGLNYTSLIAPMAKAIQELTARIAALEEKP